MYDDSMLYGDEAEEVPEGHEEDEEPPEENDDYEGPELEHEEAPPLNPALALPDLRMLAPGDESDDACLYRSRSADGAYAWNIDQVKAVQARTEGNMYILSLAIAMSSPRTISNPVLWDEARVRAVVDTFRDWNLRSYVYFAVLCRMTGERLPCVNPETEPRFVGASGFMKLSIAGLNSMLYCLARYMQDTRKAKRQLPALWASVPDHGLLQCLTRRVLRWRTMCIADAPTGLRLFSPHQATDEGRQEEKEEDDARFDVPTCDALFAKDTDVWQNDWADGPDTQSSEMDLVVGRFCFSRLHKSTPATAPSGAYASLSGAINNVVASTSQKDLDESKASEWEASYALIESFAAMQSWIDVQAEYVRSIQWSAFKPEAYRTRAVEAQIHRLFDVKPDPGFLNKFRAFLHNHVQTGCMRQMYMRSFPSESGSVHASVSFRMSEDPAFQAYVRDISRDLDADVRNGYWTATHPLRPLLRMFALVYWFDTEGDGRWLERFYISSYQFPEMHYLIQHETRNSPYERRRPIVVCLLGRWAVVRFDRTGVVCETGVQAMTAWMLEMLFEFQGQDEFLGNWLDKVAEALPEDYASFAAAHREKRARKKDRRRERRHKREEERQKRKRKPVEDRKQHEDDGESYHEDDVKNGVPPPPQVVSHLPREETDELDATRVEQTRELVRRGVLPDPARSAERLALPTSGAIPISSLQLGRSGDHHHNARRAGRLVKRSDQGEIRVVRNSRPDAAVVGQADRTEPRRKRRRSPPPPVPDEPLGRDD